MKQVMLILLTGLTIGCRDGYNREMVNAVDHALQEASVFVRESSAAAYRRVEDKQRNWRGRNRGGLWLAKAKEVSALSVDVYRYIDSLKQQLAPEDDSRACKRFYENGPELYKKLVDFQWGVIDALPMQEYAENPGFLEQMRKDRTRILKYMNGYIDTSGVPLLTSAEWVATNLNIHDKQLALAMLCKFQNDVLTTGKDMYDYMHNQFNDYFCGYFAESLFVKPLGACVKAGDPLQVYVGLGRFSFADSYPRFIVNDSEVLVDRSDWMVYRFPASDKPGVYRTPIRIEYYNRSGKIDTFYKQLSYTVAE